MQNPKFQESKDKLILKAQNEASSFLLAKYGNGKITSCKDSLTHKEAVLGGFYEFSGSITITADVETGRGFHQVEMGMTVNTNDIEVESTNLQEKIENSLNRSQETNLQDTTVHASLDAFILTDDGTPYLKVSHVDLNGADLGIVGKNEYAKSPDKVALLKSIITDKLTRIASEGSAIVFTGTFAEPTIIKQAAGCDQCAASMINGVFCHETGCPNKKRKTRDDDEQADVESSKKSWLTADFDEPEMDIPADYPVQPLDDDHEVPGKATCGTCNRSWDDSVSTSMTPTPSGRCPFEQFHSATEPIAIQENMPRATQSNKLTQDMQVEAQITDSAKDKVKNQAVNALVSMLQSMGFGSAKVAEVTPSAEGFDIMTTLDHAGTTKAVSIPVAIKEATVVLPKKSLVSTLINKGLDIRARLSEDFSQEVLLKIAAIEEKLAYETNEVTSILNDTPEVVVEKVASDSSNEQFMGDTDVLTVQKHLLPNHEDLKEGDVISDGANDWEIFDTEAQQNDKNEGSSSEWKLRKKPTPQEDKKKSKERMDI